MNSLKQAKLYCFFPGVQLFVDQFFFLCNSENHDAILTSLKAQLKQDIKDYILSHRSIVLQNS